MLPFTSAEAVTDGICFVFIIFHSPPDYPAGRYVYETLLGIIHAYSEKCEKKLKSPLFSLGYLICHFRILVPWCRDCVFS